MLLEMQNVTKTFAGREGPVHALAEVSLSLDAGQFVAVQGPSGCGKSTLLLTAGALLAPDDGRVVIDGQEPYRLGSGRRARFRAEKVGFVFQQFHLVPYLTVRENILAPTLARPSAEARDEAERLLERFALRHRSRHLAGELSTGERQRAALARALLNRPRLLLADEPTGNLDQENAEVVLQHLETFTHEGGSVLLITHNDQAAARAQQTLRMRAGRLEPQAGQAASERLETAR